MSVLDLGCGPGSITLDLAEIVAPGRVIGIENVDEPLAAARRGARERGDVTTIFERSDALSLPYADSSFDVVHAHQVLQHVNDPVALMREMARVCKPEGIVAARDVDYEAMTWHPTSPGLTLWLDTYRLSAKASGHEPDAGRNMRKWARRAGLRDVKVSTSTWCYADPDSTRWWGESQAERVLTPAFKDRAHAQGLTGEDVQDIANAWREWGHDPDAFFVMVHGEILAGARHR